ncbi:transposable element Tcb2 transposase [Trichonephila clavipes]|nr:transposable element Tcb2 transposase [Trichonephila clavipes]
MRAFGDGPRNFEPWSSNVDDTRAGTPSPNYHTTPTGEQCNKLLIHGLENPLRLFASCPIGRRFMHYLAIEADKLVTLTSLVKMRTSQQKDLEPFLETESAGRRPGQGRRRATTPNEDRFLVLTARRQRNMNATLLQQHLRSATGNTV